MGHSPLPSNARLSETKRYGPLQAASQAGRREFESDRPLQTSGSDTRRLLASCSANSSSVKTLREAPVPPVDLPRVDSRDIPCPPWTAFRHRVGHPASPRLRRAKPACLESTELVTARGRPKRGDQNVGSAATATAASTVSPAWPVNQQIASSPAMSMHRHAQLGIRRFAFSEIELVDVVLREDERRAEEDVVALDLQRSQSAGGYPLGASDQPADGQLVGGVDR